MMQSKNQAQIERRRFFRIDDDIRLVYRRQGEALPNTVMKQPSPLLAGLELINKDSRKQLCRVERLYPEVGAYMKTLESKLDFITRSLLLMQEPELMQQSNRIGSISATGVAFDLEIDFPVGEILELKMVLLSSMIFIANPVKVIYCKQVESDTVEFSHHMGVDFIDMDESAREQQIQHVFNRQQAQRRQLR